MHLHERNIVCKLYEVVGLVYETKGQRNLSLDPPADSATGTATVNEALGTSRANFIADELMQRGVPSAQITKRNHGGIDDYSPTEANRQTKVMLHFK